MDNNGNPSDISGGGEIDGSILITQNLQVDENAIITGDLQVEGTITSDLKVVDAIIQTAIDNTLTDNINTGIISHYGDGVEKFSGLIRSKDDKKFYLMNNETVLPTDSGTINNSEGDLKLRNLEASNDVTIGGIAHASRVRVQDNHALIDVTRNTDQYYASYGFRTTLNTDWEIRLDANTDDLVIFHTNTNTMVMKFDAATEAVIIGDGLTNYTLPTQRGMLGQVLKTDANGVVTWEDSAGGIVNNSTGVISGGLLTVNADTTKFDISDGSGQIVALDNTITTVTWTGKTALTHSWAGSIVHFISIDSTNTVIYRTTPLTNTQIRNEIYLGVIVSVDGINVTTTNDQQMTIAYTSNSLRDLYEAIGFINESGNILSQGSGSNLTITKSQGVMVKYGSNYKNDPKNPHNITLPTIDTGASGIFQYRMQDGTSSALTLTELIPNILDDGTAYPGNTIDGNKWGVSRVYSFTSNALKIQPTQEEYKDQNKAIEGIINDEFVTEPSIVANGMLIGYIIAKGDGSSVSYRQASKFSGGGGGSGGPVSENLQSVYDNSTQPQILTNDTGEQLVLKRGTTGDDNDIVFEIQNGSGIPTLQINGSGSLVTSKLYINENKDVNIVSPAEGHILSYNNTFSRWDNIPLPSFASDLNGLTDVSISAPAQGHILTYNNGLGLWQNLQFPDTFTDLQVNGKIKLNNAIGRIENLNDDICIQTTANTTEIICPISNAQITANNTGVNLFSGTQLNYFVVSDTDILSYYNNFRRLEINGTETKINDTTGNDLITANDDGVKISSVLEVPKYYIGEYVPPTPDTPATNVNWDYVSAVAYPTIDMTLPTTSTTNFLSIGSTNWMIYSTETFIPSHLEIGGWIEFDSLSTLTTGQTMIYGISFAHTYGTPTYSNSSEVGRNQGDYSFFAGGNNEIGGVLFSNGTQWQSGGGPSKPIFIRLSRVDETTYNLNLTSVNPATSNNNITLNASDIHRPFRFTTGLSPMSGSHNRTIVSNSITHFDYNPTTPAPNGDYWTLEHDNESCSLKLANTSDEAIFCVDTADNFNINGTIINKSGKINALELAINGVNFPNIAGNTNDFLIFDGVDQVSYSDLFQRKLAEQVTANNASVINFNPDYEIYFDTLTYNMRGPLYAGEITTNYNSTEVILLETTTQRGIMCSQGFVMDDVLEGGYVEWTYTYTNSSGGNYFVGVAKKENSVFLGSASVWQNANVACWASGGGAYAWGVSQGSGTTFTSDQDKTITVRITKNATDATVTMKYKVGALPEVNNVLSLNIPNSDLSVPMFAIMGDNAATLSTNTVHVGGLKFVDWTPTGNQVYDWSIGATKYIDENFTIKNGIGTEILKIDKATNDISTGTSSQLVLDRSLSTGGIDVQKFLHGAGTNWGFKITGQSAFAIRNVTSAGNIISISATAPTLSLVLGPTSVNLKHMLKFESDAYIDNTADLVIQNGNSNTIRVIQDTNGVKLDSNATSWTSNSDRRLKTDLKVITNALDKVKKISGYTGRYIEDDVKDSRSFVIAQEVEKVLPQAVSMDKDTKMLGVRYTELIPLLINAINELSLKVELLSK